MRRPEVKRIQISRGDWIDVKKHLTAGERRREMARMIKPGGFGETPSIDPVAVGHSKMVAYLLDWSLTDADDKPLVIRDQPPEVVGAILDDIDDDAFKEILNAVEDHEREMDAEREAEKKSRDTVTLS